MNKFINSKKGFILSTDAFLGLALMFIVVLVSYAYINQSSNNTWSSLDLVSFARDEAAVLEKSLALKNSILSSSAEPILEYISFAPDAYCIEVNIFSSSNLVSPIITATKPGCTKSFSNIAFVDRTVVVNSGSSINYYIAKVGVWFKEGQS